jgi:hypothetical protein
MFRNAVPCSSAKLQTSDVALASIGRKSASSEKMRFPVHLMVEGFWIFILDLQKRVS